MTLSVLPIQCTSYVNKKTIYVRCIDLSVDCFLHYKQVQEGRVNLTE